MNNSERTNWNGLWKNREGVYSGQIIAKKDIPPYSRLIIRYNKFYKKDSNLPRFVFCFANGEASKAITMERKSTDIWAEYDEDTDAFYDNEGNRLYTYNDVQKAIDGATRDAQNGYTDNIVTDYL